MTETPQTNKTMKLKSTKKFLTFSRKLFFSVIALFLLFTVSFIIYQYHREREYKIQLLHARLQSYNRDIDREVAGKEDGGDADRYEVKREKENLRVTIIGLDGGVLYDSDKENTPGLDSHSGRKEIEEATVYGSGYDVRRTSETTGISYFYSATRCPDYIVRTALPYDTTLRESLQVDKHYLWFAIITALMLMLIFYGYTGRIGLSINRLKDFAARVERNEPIKGLDDSDFSNDELSEIAKHIIELYKRLHETKEKLVSEQEKLIAHFQNSREGLGIFTHDKKEVLVNNLLYRYANLISDHSLKSTEEIFELPELQKVTDFIRRPLWIPSRKDEMKMSYHIDKNGRTFVIECVVFHDASFEISINDISYEEEQVQIKRQLTQNVAHELKTPVSSIQAYLETIVENPNLPDEKKEAFLLKCYEQSIRLTSLLRDISILTRMDGDKNMMEVEKVNITAIVNGIVNEVLPEAEKKGITIENLLKENIIIRGNNSLIYSIFRNLMDNAVSYAGENIRVTINCFREDESYYYFSFADNGTGVGNDQLQRLFERFYRIDKGRSRKLGGTGLGLAIVKNAVIAHKGNILAKKNQPEGMEFIFTLAKDN